MNDFIEKPPFINKTICMFIIGFLLGFLVCYTLPSRNGTSAGETISAIKEQQHLVNHEINNVNNGIKSAEKSIQTVSNTVSGMQGIARQNADGIDRISKIVGECYSIAEENRNILEQIGEANKSR